MANTPTDAGSSIMLCWHAGRWRLYADGLEVASFTDDGEGLRTATAMLDALHRDGLAVVA